MSLALVASVAFSATKTRRQVSLQRLAEQVAPQIFSSVSACPCAWADSWNVVAFEAIVALAAAVALADVALAAVALDGVALAEGAEGSCWLGRAVVPLQLQLSCRGRRASSIISNGCMGVSHGSGLRLRLWHVVRSAATAHTQHDTTRHDTRQYLPKLA